MTKKIIGIEIENPYRYRAYAVGKETMFDIQNEAFTPAKEDVISNIKPITDYFGDIVRYEVVFNNGTSLEITATLSGLIIHYDKEVENDS